jgi:hypothetical protein
LGRINELATESLTVQFTAMAQKNADIPAAPRLRHRRHIGASRL